MSSFLIVGGGHIGLGVIAYLSSLGNTVYLYSRRTSNEPIQTIHSVGPLAAGEFPIAYNARRLSEIASHNGNRLPTNIIVCCRGQDLHSYASLLAPYCHSQTNFLLLCAARFSGRAFSRYLQQAGMPGHRVPAIADVNNVPFICRGNGRDRVAIKALTRHSFFAAQSPEFTERLLATYRCLFRKVCPLNDPLVVNLNKCNDIIHVPTVWATLDLWKTGQDYNPYRNLTLETIHRLEKLDRDRLAVCRALEISPSIDLCEHYRLAYGTNGPTLFDRIQELHAYSTTTVGNPQHRYLTEDLPFGLFPLQALARVVDVETPALDDYVRQGSQLLGDCREWTAEFLNLNAVDRPLANSVC